MPATTRLLVLSSASTTLLEATGKLLGLFAKGEYEVGTSVIPDGGALLLFTDGLTDAIRGNNPEAGLRNAFYDDSRKTMSNLKFLVDPKFNHDDVTILLVKREQIDSKSASSVES